MGTGQGNSHHRHGHGELSRRWLLGRAGLLGGSAATASVAHEPGPAAAEPPVTGGYRWLAGDHHIHTQYSHDGLYRVVDQVRHASAYGLGWMVITDHGGEEHARLGVEKVNPDIRAAREAFRDVLIFQGLEWNVPAAEHGTVFVHPGRDEVAVLKEFENAYDSDLVAAGTATPAREALAIAGVHFLADAVDRRRVADALFLANHPSARGLDSPHEIRGWRDAQPRIAVGMEGAPGHQAAGIPSPDGPGGARGNYSYWPSEDSFPGYPPESYLTWGGFDWMTATVGGLWDSLLAEGRPWWITANSDCHKVYGDTAILGQGAAFSATGHHPDPAYAGRIRLGYNGFWPGFYSRTHVGARDHSYAAVMDGIRAGRVWVDHGGLVAGLDVRARVAGSPAGARAGVTLGDTLWVRPGTRVELAITVRLATTPNWAQFVPTLARLDLIGGDVTGPAADRDTFTAPGTRVVGSFEINRSHGLATVTYPLGPVDRPRYYRLRGTDGNRSAPGFLGSAVDPAGPALDVAGDADPWTDLWCYTNPIWIMPRG